jgi:hypothetical protein
MEHDTVETEAGNVLDFGEWNGRLREQRAREEARRNAEEQERQLSLLLHAFRS